MWQRFHGGDTGESDRARTSSGSWPLSQGRRRAVLGDMHGALSYLEEPVWMELGPCLLSPGLPVTSIMDFTGASRGILGNLSFFPES